MARTIRFHLDECCGPAVADGLRRRSIDVTTLQEAGLIEAADEQQAEYDVTENRVVFTHDIDFLRLQSAGVPHAGIIYRAKDTLSVGEMIKRLVLVWEVYEPDEMVNRVEFLKVVYRLTRIPRSFPLHASRVRRARRYRRVAFRSAKGTCFRGAKDDIESARMRSSNARIALIRKSRAAPATIPPNVTNKVGTIRRSNAVVSIGKPPRGSRPDLGQARPPYSRRHRPTDEQAYRRWCTSGINRKFSRFLAVSAR